MVWYAQECLYKTDSLIRQSEGQCLLIRGHPKITPFWVLSMMLWKLEKQKSCLLVKYAPKCMFKYTKKTQRKHWKDGCKKLYKAVRRTMPILISYMLWCYEASAYKTGSLTRQSEGQYTFIKRIYKNNSIQDTRIWFWHGSILCNKYFWCKYFTRQIAWQGSPKDNANLFS